MSSGAGRGKKKGPNSERGCLRPELLHERQAKRLRAINDAVLSIASELSTDKVLQRIVDSARGLMNAEYAALGVLDVTGAKLERFIVSGISPEVIAQIGQWPHGQGLLGALIREPRPLRVSPIAHEARSVGFPPHHPPMSSFLGVPLISHGRVLGNFYLTNKLSAEEFNEEDEQTLVLFAAHAAIAIDNARLYSETHDALRQKMDEVSAMAEQSRRRTEEMNSLLESLTEGVTVAGVGGNIVLLNAAGRRLLGLSEGPSELQLERYRQLDLRSLDGRPLSFDEWPLGRTLAGERFANYELNVVLGDGSVRRLSFSGTCLCDEGGSTILGMTVYRDVTELRELERLRQEYVSLISHDLRAPLSVVQGQAELLQRNLASGRYDRLRGSAEAIFQGSRRMAAMIQDLADSARWESGHPELRREVLSLPVLLRDTIQRTVEPSQVERIHVRVEEGLPKLHADPDRLGRVLANLLTNALKYSPGETIVDVGIERRGGEVVVSVRDKGVGIDADELPHVFGRFFRARTGRKAEGLGLGLYIARQLAEAHGGRIWVESPNPQSTNPSFPGSTFYLALPID